MSSKNLLIENPEGKVISRYNQNYYCHISEVIIVEQTLRIRIETRGDLSLGGLQSANSSRLSPASLSPGTIRCTDVSLSTNTETHIEGWLHFPVASFTPGTEYNFSFGVSGYLPVRVFQFPAQWGEEKKKDEKKKAAIPAKGFRDFSLQSSFGALLRNPKFSDVTFIIGDKQIPAHRLVLSRASPFFETMLYARQGDGKFDVTVEKTLQIELKNVDVSAFESMLQCIYTDQVEVNSSNLQQLLKLGTKYQLPKLLGACNYFMASGLTQENVLEMFEVAPRILGDKNFGVSFIGENIYSLINTPGWLKLSKDRMLVLVKSELLQIEEVTLFDALSKWAKHQLSQGTKEGTTEAEILRDFVPHIRFPLIDVGVLATKITPSGILTQQQLVTLFAYASVTDEKLRALLPNPGWTTSPRTGGEGAIIELKLHTRLDKSSRNQSYTCGTAASLKEAKDGNFQYIRTEGYIFKNKLPDTVRLEVWYKVNTGHYFVLANSFPTEGVKAPGENRLTGFKFLRTEGYIYARPRPQTVALTTYTTTRKDFRLAGTTKSGEEARSSGYSVGKIEGYALSKRG